MSATPSKIHRMIQRLAEKTIEAKSAADGRSQQREVSSHLPILFGSHFEEWG